MPERATKAARTDEAIAAARERYRQEHGEYPSQRLTAELTGFSPATVNVSLKRAAARQAGEPEPPPRKRKQLPHILRAAEQVVLAASRTEDEELPTAVRRKLALLLAGRDDWQTELRQAVEAALLPRERPALATEGDDDEDILADLKALRLHLREEVTATGTEGRGARADLLKVLSLWERVQPTEQREDMVPRAQITEAAVASQAKLQQLLGRLRARHTERRRAALEQAAERGDEFYAGAAWALRQMGDLPKEGDGGDEQI